MEKPLLSVTDLKVVINNHLILDKVNFAVKKNETLAIIGPNGAGKTTLFRALLGLVPYEGKIQWQPQVKIGYVPQKLFIDRDLPLTAEEFFALKEGRVKKEEVDAVLSLVGFEDSKLPQAHSKDQVLKKKLGVLSGGELQRILIAWALLDHPDVLLFDEPTAGIDLSVEVTIYSLLHQLQEKENLTILLISHELQVVYKYATNVVCLNKDEICFGPPHQSLDRENLVKLFGSDVGFYLHH